MRFGPIAATALLFAGAPSAARADIVSDWYETEVAASKASENPDVNFDPEAVQSFSKLTLAMFEAADAVDRRYQSYLKLPAAPRGASIDAAVATAAHDVMLAMHPGQKGMIDNAYALAIARVVEGQARADGIATGHAAAKAALAAGGIDAKLPPAAYRPNGAPGQFVPVTVPIDPRLLQVRPWFLKSIDEFRVGPPVALTSADWAAAVNEVQSKGAKDSKTRTEAETAGARFWAGYSLAATLRQVADQPGRSIVANARMYAMIEMGGDDSSLVMFEAKMHYGFWRPLSAIRGAGDDNNPATTPDIAWVPLLRTPPQPEYPCGHCVFAGFVAAVMEGEGALPPGGLHFTSDTLAGVAMTVTDWPSFEAAVSNSRINGGVHFRTTNRVSTPIGEALGKAVRARFAPPLN
ncbi:MAG: vanadium-dependent haloperoxidase [Sphingomonas sp.]|nr:vanadium-dependent haloperoxidase [Sphingomonas sp.]